MRKIRLAKLDIVTNYKNTEKAGVIKVMRRKICGSFFWGWGLVLGMLLRDGFEGWDLIWGRGMKEKKKSGGGG